MTWHHPIFGALPAFPFFCSLFPAFAFPLSLFFSPAFCHIRAFPRRLSFVVAFLLSFTPLSVLPSVLSYVPLPREKTASFPSAHPTPWEGPPVWLARAPFLRENRLSRRYTPKPLEKAAFFMCMRPTLAKNRLFELRATDFVEGAARTPGSRRVS